MTAHHDNHRPSAAAAPMGCNDLKAALSAYLDDELTRDERLRERGGDLLEVGLEVGRGDLHAEETVAVLTRAHVADE